MEVIDLLSSDDGEDASPATTAREACHLDAKRDAAAASGVKVTQDEDDDNDSSAASSSSSNVLLGEGRGWKSTAKGGKPMLGKRVSMDDDGGDCNEEEELEIVAKPRSITMKDTLVGSVAPQKQARPQPRPPSKKPRQGTRVSLTTNPRSPASEAQGRTPTLYPISFRSLPLQPEVPPPLNATWRVVLLMDHREFGNSTTFLQEVETKINKHFAGAYSEVEALPAADYYFVARLVANDGTERVLDERVLDLVIERKCVADLAQCLILDSKKYRPLSFFEAQMYKFQHCGMRRKLFLVEGDEDVKNVFRGANSNQEKLNRLKRIKTSRLRLERGEWDGVDVICTRNKQDTIKFLIQQLDRLQRSFDPRRPPTKTMKELKAHIETEMKNPTFQKYLGLRQLPNIGDAKAMKIIRDPHSDWDKTFVSPAGKSKPSKATLADRATFWGDPPRASALTRPSPSASATSQKAPPNNTKIYRKIADSLQETQRALQQFDGSDEGKERMKLDKKDRHSQKEVTPQDTADLEALHRRRASLTRARNLAKKEKDEDGITVAAKALDDFDKSENGGRKRKKLMEKNKHSQLQMTQEELARLKELNDWRRTLANPRTQPQEMVAACRKAVGEFDETEEGKERSKLYEKEKQSKEKLTSQDNADIEELSEQRKVFAEARAMAKQANDDHGFAVARQELDDFDASRTGRKLLNLKTKRRWSRKKLTVEEVARLKELNEKRRDLELGKSGAGLERRLRTASAASATELPGNGTEKRKHAATDDGDDDDDKVPCGLCFGTIDIWSDDGVVSCNRVAACGASFHQSCLTTHGHDISAHDGCIKCQDKSNFSAKNAGGTSDNACKTTVANAAGPAAAQNAADVIILDSDDEKMDDVCVID